MGSSPPQGHLYAQPFLAAFLSIDFVDVPQLGHLYGKSIFRANPRPKCEDILMTEGWMTEFNITSAWGTPLKQIG